MHKNSSYSDGKKSHILIPRKTLVIIAAISLLWCIWAGQGAFIHQTLDNLWRNATFHDLIKKPWPVIYKDNSMLCYYIAHWMAPAAVGKAVYLISGSVYAGYFAGNIALLIYTSFGCFLTLLLTAVITQRKKNAHFIVAAVVFIFFSGLDTAGKWFIPVSFLGNNIEWWGSYFQFSSVSTCLFWAYNQSVAAWLATICILNERSTKNYALLGMLALPFAPFPFIGLVAICLIKAVFMGKREIGRKRFGKFLKNTASLQNILVFTAVGIPYALYYSANSIVAGNAYYNGVKLKTGLRLHDELTYAFAKGNTKHILDFIVIYLVFFMMEAGVLLLLIKLGKKKKKVTAEFIVYTVVLAIIPLIQMGKDYDFSMRVSIPFIIYIAMEFIRTFTAKIPKRGTIKRLEDIVLKTPWFTAAVIAFIIGAVTPATEYIRQLALTFSVGPPDYFICESMEDFDEINNFSAQGYEESYFGRLIMKRHD
ncbi:MAG: hypothetical protein K2K57_06435 [Oscillospiraceae bacterium]|nr:hypothetical protein [Oscillospiraceae bacterium]